MRISDWSSDVCSSDLATGFQHRLRRAEHAYAVHRFDPERAYPERFHAQRQLPQPAWTGPGLPVDPDQRSPRSRLSAALQQPVQRGEPPRDPRGRDRADRDRSEEHTSELQTLMSMSYAVYCLKQKTTHYEHTVSHLILE